MNEDQIKKLQEKRNMQLGSLVSSPPVNNLEHLVAENVEISEALPVSEGINIKTETFVTYNIKVKSTQVEFIQRYAYTRSCQLGRRVTIAEAVEDAIIALERHTTFELKPLPEWKKKNKKQWTRKQSSK